MAQKQHGANENGNHIDVPQNLFPLYSVVCRQLTAAMRPNQNQLHNEKAAGIDNILLSEQCLNQWYHQDTCIGINHRQLFDCTQLAWLAQNRCKQQKQHMNCCRSCKRKQQTCSYLRRIIYLKCVNNHTRDDQIDQNHRYNFAVLHTEQLCFHQRIAHKHNQEKFCNFFHQNQAYLHVLRLFFCFSFIISQL